LPVSRLVVPVFLFSCTEAIYRLEGVRSCLGSAKGFFDVIELRDPSVEAYGPSEFLAELFAQYSEDRRFRRFFPAEMVSSIPGP